MERRLWERASTKWLSDITRRSARAAVPLASSALTSRPLRSKPRRTNLGFRGESHAVVLNEALNRAARNQRMPPRLNPTMCAVIIASGAILFALTAWRVGWPSEYSDPRTISLICAGGAPLVTGLIFNGLPWNSSFERWISIAAAVFMWAMIGLTLIAPHLLPVNP